jgi:hypothetical protein
MEKVFSRVLKKDKMSNKILVIEDRSNVWNFLGGKEEKDESPSECAKREYMKKLGFMFMTLRRYSKRTFFLMILNGVGTFICRISKWNTSIK